MKTSFDSLEKRLQALIEDGLPRLVSGKRRPISLAQEFIHEMEANLVKDSSGLNFAPDIFTLTVPEAEFDAWCSYQDILDEIAAEIHKAGLQSDYQFHKTPHLFVCASDSLKPPQIKITADISPFTKISDTSAFATNTQQPAKIPHNAFLVINGDKDFPLTKPLIQIGRRSDNDLVLHDAQVSRLHAQLRAINNRFILFDLGSTSGTHINGVRISQAALNPGDVVQIGASFLIYSQDGTDALQNTHFMPLEE